MPIPGTKKITRIEENIFSENIIFSQDELKDIRNHLEMISITGQRYSDAQEELIDK